MQKTEISKVIGIPVCGFDIHQFSSLINLRAFFRDDQTQPAAPHADPKDGRPAECKPPHCCVGCLRDTKRSNIRIVPKFQHAAQQAEEKVAPKGANATTFASAKRRQRHVLQPERTRKALQRAVPHAGAKR